MTLELAWTSRHILITQAADSEVGTLWQEENATLAVNRAFEHPRPSGPKLCDDTGDRRFTNAAEVSNGPDMSITHFGPVINVCSPFSTLRSKLCSSSSPPRSALPPAGATTGTPWSNT